VGFFILVWQYFIILDLIEEMALGTDYCQRDVGVFVLQEYKLGA
jgi:hypothetical protein